MKSPAYAKRLLAQRADGVHPLRLSVYFGAPWPFVDEHQPAVCVGMDWRPWSLDWKVAAGLWVDVYECAEVPTFIHGHPSVWWLAAEIQAVAANVVLQRESGSARISALAAMCFEEDGKWPPWWPDALGPKFLDRWVRYWATPEAARARDESRSANVTAARRAG